jgi:pimeloyl-ACP methyl ester carboxylesterase
MVSNGAWERLSSDEQQSRRDDGAALLDDLRVLRGAPPFDVADVGVATTYAFGDGDRSEYYVALVEKLRERNPAFLTVQLTNANHGAHLSNPDQLAHVVHDAWRLSCE